MLAFLLALADERDQEKVTELYDKYHVEMYKIAMSKLGQYSNATIQAEEAVQNAFVKIIDRFEAIRFEDGEKSIHAYVLTIASHEAINLLRKSENIESLDNMDQEVLIEGDFADELFRHWTYKDVVQALEEMDDRYSIPLQLKYANDLTVNEIASVLDMNVKTVYTNLSRGKILLALALKRKEQGK